MMAADYTNRSVDPMLHLLRESSVTKAVTKYENPENIPGRNVDFARKKDWLYEIAQRLLYKFMILTYNHCLLAILKKANFKTDS